MTDPAAQLALAIDPPDDFEDVDLEHAERVLAAELADASARPQCSCLGGPLILLDDDYAEQRCHRCGRWAP